MVVVVCILKSLLFVSFFVFFDGCLLNRFLQNSSESIENAFLKKQSCKTFRMMEILFVLVSEKSSLDFLLQEKTPTRGG